MTAMVILLVASSIAIPEYHHQQKLWSGNIFSILFCKHKKHSSPHPLYDVAVEGAEPFWVGG